MGESACLRRSFSDSSGDPRMGDAIRALGDSISFGRFMSETLAWEKWSSFSQNRYLEEVQKFSKPGSVAQKKAYFEARYKRNASKKAADADAEAPPPANNLPEPETSNETHNTSSDDLDTLKYNNTMIIEESGGQEAHNADTVVHEIHNNTSSDELDTNKENSPMIIDESVGQQEACNSQLLVDCEDKIDLEEVEGEEAELLVIVQDPPAQVGFSDQNDNVEEEMIMPLKETANVEKNPANKKQPKSCCSKSSAQGRAGASKLGASPAHARKENNPPPSTKKPAQDAMDKKRVTPKSLHMSINFASLAGETNKKASPVLQKNRNSRISTIASKITKDSLRSTIRASMNGIPKHTSATTSTLENRRTRTLLGRSVSGNRTAEEKWQSLLADRQPQPFACGSKSRSPIIPSPFRFRSEERVAKRKEFFQKLEENNAKEAEKMQLRTKSKEKPKIDLKKLPCSVTFKAIPTTDSSRETESSSNHMKKGKGESKLKKLRHSITFKSGSWPETDSPCNHIMKEKGNGELKMMRNNITFRTGSYHETDSPGNQIKKTPSTRWPWSPKLGRKPTPSVVQDTNSRLPRMPSARTDSSKPATEKNKLLQPKKISQENASPNIQL